MIRRITVIPLTVALLFFPSVRYTLALDGAGTEYYGFPLPWNSRALATSVAKEVYLLPLAIDLAVLTVLSVFVLKSLARLPHPIIKSTVVAIWVWGLLCAATTLIILAFGSIFQVWPSPAPFHISEVALSVGLLLLPRIGPQPGCRAGLRDEPRRPLNSNVEAVQKTRSFAKAMT
jgi:hypothetical protein